MSIVLDPVSRLPTEISLNSFFYLNKSDLVSCCQVSKGWRTLADDNQLWKAIAYRTLKDLLPEDISQQCSKAFIKEWEARKLKSNEEIIACLQAFVDRISLGQNARFRCVISTGSQYQIISAQISAGNIDRTLDIHGTPRYLTHFDFSGDYFGKNIGNGSLLRPQRPPQLAASGAVANETIEGQRVTVYVLRSFQVPFQAILRFPDLPPLNSHHRIDMQDRIMNILACKIHKLCWRSGFLLCWRSSFLINSIKIAIGVGLLGIGVHGMWQKK